MVYEHWRPDTDACFYVGKGHGNRAGGLKRRNRHHLNVQKKLAAQGLSVEVRIIKSDLTEKDALALEIERIAIYPREQLTNQTDGGDGCTGYKHKPEFIDALRTRMKGKRYALGLKRSPEVCEKNRLNRLKQIIPPGTGYRFTPEQKARLAASGTTRMSGHKHSEATKERIRTTQRLRQMAKTIAQYDIHGGEPT